MAFSPHPGRGRGGFAPRRGRGGPQSRFTKREVKPDINKNPVGELLTTVDNADLNVKSTKIVGNASIEDCEYVASYSWIDAKAPTIKVPGRPPLWTPLQHPRRLEEDSGTFFRDPNAARFPAFPTQPAVEAILHINPKFPTEEVDIFGCGSTLGNLLRFVRGIDKPFRFHLETVGNTVFFVRKENDPRETIDGVRGYGHTFPEAYTTWEHDVRGSESHQRLIQYKFGGCNCLVRFECDGYLPGIGSAPTAKVGAQASTQDADELLGAFESIKITRDIPVANGSLQIQSAGHAPLQEAIFDLKTRSGRFKKEIDMADIYPMLWIKQFQNFVIGYHDGAGTFQDIRVQDVREDVKSWEQDNRAAIRRLAVLLEKIVKFARQNSDDLLEVYRTKADRLEIRKQHGQGSHVLPERLRERWNYPVDGGAPILASGYEKSTSGSASHSLGFESDDETPDFTACSADECGYCGKCTY